ncbi:MAG TPA: nucleoside-diphosphate kinase [Nitrososphaeraceae archaeon]|jgi:nucleoside-diphosphate kinase
MAIQKTLVVIKPDAIKRHLVGKIVTRLEEKGLELLELRLQSFSEEKAKEFYAMHQEKPFFLELVSFISSGKTVACILVGNDAINVVRKMIGQTKSFEASPGTIRGDYGLGVTDNIVHASDSHESFLKESKIIFGSN